MKNFLTDWGDDLDLNLLEYREKCKRLYWGFAKLVEEACIELGAPDGLKVEIIEFTDLGSVPFNSLCVCGNVISDYIKYKKVISAIGVRHIVMWVCRECNNVRIASMRWPQ